MKLGIKITLWCLLITVGLIVLDFGAEQLGIIKIGIFEPQRENVRREVFKNTQSYVEGKTQELIKYRMEYIMTIDPQSRHAIQMTVASSCALLDDDKITDPELQRFLICMKNGQAYQ